MAPKGTLGKDSLKQLTNFRRHSINRLHAMNTLPTIITLDKDSLKPLTNFRRHTIT